MIALEELEPRRAPGGGDRISLERSAAVFVEVGPHEPSALPQAPLTGRVAEIVAGRCAYADTGVAHLQVVLEPTTPAGIEAFALVLELLSRR